MADSGNISDHEDNACEMESSVQAPINQENVLGNQNENSRKPDDLLEEKIESLLQEKLQLDEREKELQKLTSNLLQEHRRLTAERKLQEKDFITSSRSPESIAREIQNRLLVAYSTGKENEPTFEKYLEMLRKKMETIIMLNGDVVGALERKLALLESLFSKFQKQLTTIETLMNPDYDILCQENTECFTVVMTECNKLDNNIYELTSMILAE